jgi:hypothetical protein
MFPFRLELAPRLQVHPPFLINVFIKKVKFERGGRFLRALDTRRAIMAEEHAKAITTARAKLVAQRRNLVTGLGRTAKARTKGNLTKLIVLQAAIDALDKAYDDEKADMVG